jgi:hypothetical protein
VQSYVSDYEMVRATEGLTSFKEDTRFAIVVDFWP